MLPTTQLVTVASIGLRKSGPTAARLMQELQQIEGWPMAASPLVAAYLSGTLEMKAASGGIRCYGSRHRYWHAYMIGLALDTPASFPACE